MDERTVLLLSLALACAACAELPDQRSEPRAERVYRTGSNIPVHDRTPTGNVLTLDRESFEEMMRHTNRMPPPGGTH